MELLTNHTNQSLSISPGKIQGISQRDTSIGQRGSKVTCFPITFATSHVSNYPQNIIQWATFTLEWVNTVCFHHFTIDSLKYCRDRYLPINLLTAFQLDTEIRRLCLISLGEVCTPIDSLVSCTVTLQLIKHGLHTAFRLREALHTVLLNFNSHVESKSLFNDIQWQTFSRIHTVASVY